MRKSKVKSCRSNLVHPKQSVLAPQPLLHESLALPEGKNINTTNSPLENMIATNSLLGKRKIKLSIYLYKWLK